MDDENLIEETSSPIQGTEPEITSIKNTQVYMATHDGEGNTLPFMRRSFISFSYGGKNIEDFNLIATFSSDGLESNGYANFNDLTTEYDVIQGQFYWDTVFKTNIFSITLSTDSMTQEQLDDFMEWFTPGKIKELIFAEHPNRVIYARINSIPKISMIPFELKKEIKLANQIYTTSTTEYKGNINLEFVSDDPFWYSKVSIFDKLNENMQQETWIDAQGTEVTENFLNDPDILKIVMEDNIPVKEMIHDSMWLANNIYATVENNVISRQETVLSLSANTKTYLYYPGTAPAPLKITFTITPVFGPDNMIYLPKNKYTCGQNDVPYNIITLGGSVEQQLKLTTPMIYTSYNQVINILNTVNSSVSEEADWAHIRKLIRDTVRHYIIREWFNRCLDAIIPDDEINLSQDTAAALIEAMKDLFINPNIDIPTVMPAIISIDSKTGEAIGVFYHRLVSTIDYTEPTRIQIRDEDDINFSGKTVNVAGGYYEDINKVIPGVELFVPASGTNDFYIIFPNGVNDKMQMNFSVDTNGEISVEDSSNIITDDPGENSGSNNEEPSIDDNLTGIAKVIENVQDMCVSNNLIIKGRDHIDEDGYIVKENVHYLKHDFAEPLKNVQIEYQNLYL